LGKLNTRKSLIRKICNDEIDLKDCSNEIKDELTDFPQIENPGFVNIIHYSLDLNKPPRKVYIENRYCLASTLKNINRIKCYHVEILQAKKDEFYNYINTVVMGGSYTCDIQVDRDEGTFYAFEFHKRDAVWEKIHFAHAHDINLLFTPFALDSQKAPLFYRNIYILIVSAKEFEQAGLVPRTGTVITKKDLGQITFVFNDNKSFGKGMGISFETLSKIGCRLLEEWKYPDLIVCEKDIHFTKFSTPTDLEHLQRISPGKHIGSFGITNNNIWELRHRKAQLGFQFCQFIKSERDLIKKIKMFIEKEKLPSFSEMIAYLKTQISDKENAFKEKYYYSECYDLLLEAFKIIDPANKSISNWSEKIIESWLINRPDDGTSLKFVLTVQDFVRKTTSKVDESNNILAFQNTVTRGLIKASRKDIYNQFLVLTKTTAELFNTNYWLGCGEEYPYNYGGISKSDNFSDSGYNSKFFDDIYTNCFEETVVIVDNYISEHVLKNNLLKEIRKPDSYWRVSPCEPFYQEGDIISNKLLDSLSIGWLIKTYYRCEVINNNGLTRPEIDLDPIWGLIEVKNVISKLGINRNDLKDQLNRELRKSSPAHTYALDAHTMLEGKGTPYIGFQKREIKNNCVMSTRSCSKELFDTRIIIPLSYMDYIWNAIIKKAQLVPNPNPKGRKKMVTKAYAATFLKKGGGAGAEKVNRIINEIDQIRRSSQKSRKIIKKVYELYEKESYKEALSIIKQLHSTILQSDLRKLIIYEQEQINLISKAKKLAEEGDNEETLLTLNKISNPKKYISDEVLCYIGEKQLINFSIEEFISTAKKFSSMDDFYKIVRKATAHLVNNKKYESALIIARAFSESLFRKLIIEIVGQALELGAIDDAIAIATKIELRDVKDSSLMMISAKQADASLFNDALSTAKLIDGKKAQCEILLKIAQKQADAGLFDDAKVSFDNAIGVAKKLPSFLAKQILTIVSEKQMAAGLKEESSTTKELANNYGYKFGLKIIKRAPTNE
jgi:hypothetical protein